jgi:hypothetical protein
MFFSETSTAKPIETLPYLTNLDARELASQLDVLYQTRGTSSVELVERLGLRPRLPHRLDHFFAVPSLPAVASSFCCGHIIDPNAGSVNDSASVTVSSAGVLITSLYPFHIGCPSFHLSGSAVTKHVHAASIDSPTLRP